MDAVIFDMDGVISDTQSLHADVEAEMFAARGVFLAPEEITARFAGMADGEFFRAVFGEALNAEEVDALVREKRARMGALKRGRITPMAGVVELIALLRGRDLLLAVASSSPRSFIDLVLAELALADAFPVRVSSDEVPRGKPAPDVFLRAAEHLGVPSARCAVIEDGVAGMKAARRAGMRCVGLLAEPTGSCPADVCVDSLTRLVQKPELLLGVLA